MILLASKTLLDKFKLTEHDALCICKTTLKFMSKRDINLTHRTLLLTLAHTAGKTCGGKCHTVLGLQCYGLTVAYS